MKTKLELDDDEKCGARYKYTFNTKAGHKVSIARYMIQTSATKQDIETSLT